MQIATLEELKKGYGQVSNNLLLIRQSLELCKKDTSLIRITDELIKELYKQHHFTVRQINKIKKALD